MRHPVTQSPEEQLYERVEEYQHPDLVDRIREKLHLRLQQAEELFASVKRFLCQCCLSDAPLSPTELVDEGWHNFILYTKDYADFCATYFGRFIHHVPLKAVAAGCRGNYCNGCSHGKCDGR